MYLHESYTEEPNGNLDQQRKVSRYRREHWAQISTSKEVSSTTLKLSSPTSLYRPTLYEGPSSTAWTRYWGLTDRKKILAWLLILPVAWSWVKSRYIPLSTLNVSRDSLPSFIALSSSLTGLCFIGLFLLPLLSVIFLCRSYQLSHTGLST